MKKYEPYDYINIIKPDVYGIEIRDINSGTYNLFIFDTKTNALLADSLFMSIGKYNNADDCAELWNEIDRYAFDSYMIDKDEIQKNDSIRYYKSGNYIIQIINDYIYDLYM